MNVSERRGSAEKRDKMRDWNIAFESKCRPTRGRRAVSQILTDIDMGRSGLKNRGGEEGGIQVKIVSIIVLSRKIEGRRARGGSSAGWLQHCPI